MATASFKHGQHESPCLCVVAGLLPPLTPQLHTDDAQGGRSGGGHGSTRVSQPAQQPATVQNGFRTAADASGLTEPLLLPEPAQQADAAVLLPDSGQPSPCDPFPATTAARAKAAEVARYKAMAAAGPTDSLRAALLGRSAAAATAVAVVAGKSEQEVRFQRQLSFASGLSWAVNILLLVAKMYAYWLSQSKAVLASAADSAVDLVRVGHSIAPPNRFVSPLAAAWVVLCKPHAPVILPPA